MPGLQKMLAHTRLDMLLGCVLMEGTKLCKKASSGGSRPCGHMCIAAYWMKACTYDGVPLICVIYARTWDVLFVEDIKAANGGLGSVAQFKTHPQRLRCITAAYAAKPVTILGLLGSSLACEAVRFKTSCLISALLNQMAYIWQGVQTLQCAA